MMALPKIRLILLTYYFILLLSFSIASLGQDEDESYKRSNACAEKYASDYKNISKDKYIACMEKIIKKPANTKEMCQAYEKLVFDCAGFAEYHYEELIDCKLALEYSNILINKCIDENNKDEYYFNRGEVYRCLKNYKQAEIDYSIALGGKDVIPPNPTTSGFLIRGYNRYSIKDYKGVINDLQYSGYSSGTGAYELSVSYCKLENYNKAFEIIDKCNDCMKNYNKNEYIKLKKEISKKNKCQDIN